MTRGVTRAAEGGKVSAILKRVVGVGLEFSGSIIEKRGETIEGDKRVECALLLPLSLVEWC